MQCNVKHFFIFFIRVKSEENVVAASGSLIYVEPVTGLLIRKERS